MYAKIKIIFSVDIGRTYCPIYIFRTNHTISIYECILNRTNNHDLAAEVSSWAELAGIDETYETDELSATIIYD